MIINILIVWNMIMSILFVFVIENNREKQTQIDKIKMDIENNRVFDIIVEDEDFSYRHYYHYNCKKRIVTIKEAIACLYRKGNFHLTYTPEKTKITKEDVRIK